MPTPHTQAPPPPKNKVIVTSALPYSNGDLHIGHLLEYLQSDTWVRFRKMLGDECYFFCADDTHGTPIMIAAKKQGISPEELITHQRTLHLNEFQAFNVEFTHYSSTHSEHNRRLCNAFYQKMLSHNHLFKKTIEQSYCLTCQMFLPDRLIKGTCPKCKTPDQYGDVCEACGSTYAPEELIAAACTTCHTPPTIKKSEHLFFKLDAFSQFLKEWIPNHTSQEVTQQLDNWFQQGLAAWNISRDEPYFGFAIPNYPTKYFYVWVDAPIGYISASEEWGEQHKHTTPFSEHWKNPANEIVHFIGKDIIYFHALFWPAMLKCAGFAPPARLFVHGFLTLNGEKMSKSKGTFILARTYLNSHIPTDYLRYYFISKANGSFEDVDLNLTDFKDKINSELIGKITNLASRSISMLHKRANSTLADFSKPGHTLYNEVTAKKDAIATAYREAKFNSVIITVRSLAEQTNKYFDTNAPWTKPPAEIAEVTAILSDVIQIFRILVIYLAPVLPEYTKKARHVLNEPTPPKKSSPTPPPTYHNTTQPHATYTWNDLNHPLPQGHLLNPYEHLASRITEEDLAKLLDPSTPPAATQ
ncbi:methionine--tRNA ligase [Spirochaetota bacterium]|nr:methionine--tRNA ligase [Spirochaetota bacterium]